MLNIFVSLRVRDGGLGEKDRVGVKVLLARTELGCGIDADDFELLLDTETVFLFTRLVNIAVDLRKRKVADQHILRAHRRAVEVKLQRLPDGQIVFCRVSCADKADIFTVRVLLRLKAAPLKNRRVAGVEPEHTLQIIG